MSQLPGAASVIEMKAIPAGRTGKPVAAIMGDEAYRNGIGVRIADFKKGMGPAPGRRILQKRDIEEPRLDLEFSL